MNPYPEYKDTNLPWLPQIPRHWEGKKIGELFTERKQKVSDKDFAPLSVSKHGIVPQISTVAKTDNGEDRKRVCKGDYVINSRSDRKGSSGLSEYEGSVSLINIVLQPRKSVNGQFLKYLLKSIPFVEEYYRNGRGIVADLWTTRYSEMKAIELPYPPAVEQMQIVRYLDGMTARISRLIRAKKREIGLLREQKQAIVNQAVTHGLDPNAEMKDSGIDWIGMVPKPWKIQKLSQRYYVQLGKMLDEKKNIGACPVPYLRNQDVQWGCINTSDLPFMDIESSDRERFSVKQGDLLVCEGGDVGRCAIYHDSRPCYYQKALIRLRPHSYIDDTPVFLEQLMCCAAKLNLFSFQTGKATIPHLPAEKLAAIHFVFPPMEEQMQIVQYLEQKNQSFEKLITSVEDEISLLRAYQSSLVSSVVTGAVDIRGLAVEDVLPEESCDVGGEEESGEEDALSDE